MNDLENNSKRIHKLYWFFLVIGLVEMIGYAFILANFLAIIPGLITFIAALNSFDKITKKKSYFVGIWTLISVTEKTS